jgi:N-methylhydantoinase A
MLHIPRVLVPKLPGALSAVGILLADTVRDYSKTVMQPGDANLEHFFEELEQRAGAESGILSRSLDVRYSGQGYELNVPAGEEFASAFHRAHRRRYGHAGETREIEIVNVRLRKTIVADAPSFQPVEEKPGNGAQAVVEKRTVIFDNKRLQAAIYDRDRLRAGDSFEGPAVLVEYSATTLIPPSSSARVDAFGNVVITVPQS